MKYYFIINPNSGKIDTNQFEQRILKECSKEKIKYKIFYTHNAGDAKKFAKKYLMKNVLFFLSVEMGI